MYHCLSSREHRKAPVRYDLNDDETERDDRGRRISWFSSRSSDAIVRTPRSWEFVREGRRGCRMMARLTTPARIGVLCFTQLSLVHAYGGVWQCWVRYTEVYYVLLLLRTRFWKNSTVMISTFTATTKQVETTQHREVAIQNHAMQCHCNAWPEMTHFRMVSRTIN